MLWDARADDPIAGPWGAPEVDGHGPHVGTGAHRKHMAHGATGVPHAMEHPTGEPPHQEGDDGQRRDEHRHLSSRDAALGQVEDDGEGREEA